MRSSTPWPAPAARRPCGAPRLLALLLLLAAGCGSEVDSPRSGELSLLTYNVAGLPQGISKSNPLKNLPQISPLLNNYDLALVQEDFFYPDLTRKSVTHPYRSTPVIQGERSLMGDGLNRFSRFPFGPLSRQMFSTCHGADCGASKGLSHALTDLGRGAKLHVYNLHFEAGKAAEDDAARATQIEELLAHLSKTTGDEAVVVAGDFNLRRTQSAARKKAFDDLLRRGGLTDACDATACGDERIDHVLYRSSAALSLRAVSWRVDGRFVDADGEDLSDHKPVGVRLAYSQSP